LLHTLSRTLVIFYTGPWTRYKHSTSTCHVEQSPTTNCSKSLHICLHIVNTIIIGSSRPTHTHLFAEVDGKGRKSFVTFRHMHNERMVDRFKAAVALRCVHTRIRCVAVLRPGKGCRVLRSACPSVRLSARISQKPRVHISPDFP